MYMVPSLVNVRSYLADQFSTLRTRALRDSLWAKLTGRNTKLARFPEGTFQKGLERKMIGVKEIPVKEIIGTLYRHSDFDDQFRPLKANLRDRWINIYLVHEREGWSPIMVHKVGEYYYVEDGHHRVSVARSLGIAFIQAKVWEYPVDVKQTKKCLPERCMERSAVRAYAQ